MAKTKIEVLFSDAEVAQLFKELQGLPAGQRTGRFVNEWASKRGHYVSKQSGINTVKGPFQEYLEELKAKRDMAENVSQVAQSGLGLSDAAASVLSQKVFDAALNLDVADIGGKAANNLSLAIARLRTGDQRAQMLEAKLREMERAQTEWEEQRAKVTAQIDRAKNAPAATADEVRAAAVAEIDRIMGIKTKK